MTPRRASIEERRVCVCLPCISASSSSSRCRSLKCFSVKRITTGIPNTISTAKIGTKAFARMASCAGSMSSTYSQRPSGSKRSPHHALLHRVHLRARLALEHVAEILVVGDGAVHAPAPWRVRIRHGAKPQRLGRGVLAPHLAEREEELLLGRELRVALRHLSLGPQRAERELEPADVRDVL